MKTSDLIQKLQDHLKANGECDVAVASYDEQTDTDYRRIVSSLSTEEGIGSETKLVVLL